MKNKTSNHLMLQSVTINFHYHYQSSLSEDEDADEDPCDNERTRILVRSFSFGKGDTQWPFMYNIQQTTQSNNPIPRLNIIFPDTGDSDSWK